MVSSESSQGCNLTSISYSETGVLTLRMLPKSLRYSNDQTGKIAKEHPKKTLPIKAQQSKCQTSQASKSILDPGGSPEYEALDSLSRTGALRSLTLVTFFSLVPLQMSCKRAPLPRCSSLLSLGCSVFAWRKREM